MYKHLINFLYIFLTLSYIFILIVLLGQLDGLDLFDYFGIEYKRIQDILLTTISLWVFFILLFYNYFYSLILIENKLTVNNN